MRPSCVLSAVAGFLLLCGCQPVTVPTGSSNTPTSGSSTPITTPSAESRVPTTTPESTLENGGDANLERTTTPDENSLRLIRLAKKDLSERLHVSASGIQVLSVEAVMWPDTSLGCPQPGMAYAQMVTPGFVITLEAAGEKYFYHTDGYSEIILCPDSKMPDLPVTPSDIQDGKPWMPVP